ncbi:uncharacterized protein CTHT_0020150 [Thermochaetoides thermophila DSM 1495]|uniref:Uncharacterized protein n=1 Tax=Chaetomium thermophilum (strain DSM 1495 / CBS 144.50 / IMI 039719) TaxID=759272 RepID=G0S392_CHATD|nr:hypothetical protein CTHT_0020150 [Thermochaetoides thermophila DSM 1495]EGS22475.1 hypothetical protein CTHT_0020150 [Thermochaetoides thermophila DSM 1495]
MVNTQRIGGPGLRNAIVRHIPLYGQDAAPVQTISIAEIMDSLFLRPPGQPREPFRFWSSGPRPALPSVSPTLDPSAIFDSWEPHSWRSRSACQGLVNPKIKAYLIAPLPAWMSFDDSPLNEPEDSDDILPQWYYPPRVVATVCSGAGPRTTGGQPQSAGAELLHPLDAQCSPDKTDDEEDENGDEKCQHSPAKGVSTPKPPILPIAMHHLADIILLEAMDNYRGRAKDQTSCQEARHENVTGDQTESRSSILDDDAASEHWVELTDKASLLDSDEEAKTEQVEPEWVMVEAA